MKIIDSITRFYTFLKLIISVYYLKKVVKKRCSDENDIVCAFLLSLQTIIYVLNVDSKTFEECFSKYTRNEYLSNCNVNLNKIRDRFGKRESSEVSSDILIYVLKKHDILDAMFLLTILIDKFVPFKYVQSMLVFSDVKSIWKGGNVYEKRLR